MRERLEKERTREECSRRESPLKRRRRKGDKKHDKSRNTGRRSHLLFYLSWCWFM